MKYLLVLLRQHDCRRTCVHDCTFRLHVSIARFDCIFRLHVRLYASIACAITRLDCMYDCVSIACTSVRTNCLHDWVHDCMYDCTFRLHARMYAMHAALIVCTRLDVDQIMQFLDDIYKHAACCRFHIGLRHNRNITVVIILFIIIVVVVVVAAIMVVVVVVIFVVIVIITHNPDARMFSLFCENRDPRSAPKIYWASFLWMALRTI